MAFLPSEPVQTMLASQAVGQHMMVLDTFRDIQHRSLSENGSVRLRMVAGALEPDAGASAHLGRLTLPDDFRRSRVASASLACVLLIALGLVAHKGVFWPIVSNGIGPLGTEPVPGAAVVPFVTRSGLEIYRPAHGELCWRVELCTPRPRSNLRLRGADISHGFRIEH